MKIIQKIIIKNKVIPLNKTKKHQKEIKKKKNKKLN
jgi:hypothetical protein